MRVQALHGQLPTGVVNTFYKPFDTETYRPRKGPDPYRTPFEVDRDRIIYTPAFRRLQAKTQVFMAGEFDFYRTRLTHSIEVAQVGRSICGYLNKTSELLGPDYFIDADLVEAVCLAHDLGHPPFGHAGERTLNRLMAAWGGFEGNAQTARILSETIYGEGTQRKGMAPTRALLDGVLKYQLLWSELPADSRENHFLYDDQQVLRAFVFDDPAADGDTVGEFRSIECQIMDWADDTAYSTNDIVDGCHAGFVTVDSLDAWSGTAIMDAFEQNAFENLKRTLRDRRVDGHFGRLTGEFLRACRLKPAAAPLADRTSRHAFRLVIDPEIGRESHFLQRIARELVFWSPQLHHLEHKSDFLLRRIFGVLADRHLATKPTDGRSIQLLPAAAVHALQAATDESARARVLCDYLAGMTDGYAIRTYKRLFDPDFSSIMELG